MGGWTMHIYTVEQQRRLRVDEHGQSVTTTTDEGGSVWEGESGAGERCTAPPPEEDGGGGAASKESAEAFAKRRQKTIADLEARRKLRAGDRNENRRATSDSDGVEEEVQRQYTAPNGQPYPLHWGAPPRRQTKDLRLLPGGFGHGSGTLARWITERLAADEPNAASGTAKPSKWKAPLVSAWPALVGVQFGDAVAAIEASDPKLSVVAVEAGSMVTMDHREDRVRVMYEPSTGIVSMVPRRG